MTHDSIPKERKRKRNRTSDEKEKILPLLRRSPV